jgi:hypothetical protein
MRVFAFNLNTGFLALKLARIFAKNSRQLESQKSRIQIKSVKSSKTNIYIALRDSLNVLTKVIEIGKNLAIIFFDKVLFFEKCERFFDTIT